MYLKFLQGVTRTRVEATLPDFLKRQRWFGGKARGLAAAQIADTIPILSSETDTVLLLIDVTYGDGGQDTYVLPVSLAFGEDAGRISHENPRAVLSHLTADETGHQCEGVLYDAVWEPAAMHALLRAIGQGAQFAGEGGRLRTISTSVYQDIVPSDVPLTVRVLSSDQSNTSVAFRERALLKLYRRVHPGVNPDWEIGRYLTSRGFPYTAAVGGAIEYVRSGETTTVGLLQAFVRNEGDAWVATLKELDRFFTRVEEQVTPVDSEAAKARSLWDLARQRLAEADRQLLGPALATAACLGERTAALHLTLGQADGNPDFVPEPLTPEYRRTRQESMLQMWKQVLGLMRQRSAQGNSAQSEAEQLLARECAVVAVFQAFRDIHEGGLRIRCHGDYHLGQVLYTGSDYIVTDFEGEPARPLHERRLKHSPLYDVAGMLRSFDYASWTGLAHRMQKDHPRELEPWATYWSRWVRAKFLGAYLTHVRDAPFWPTSLKDAELLLTVHQLEKAVYELGYELNNRPEWVGIPLKGINEIVRMSGTRAAA